MLAALYATTGDEGLQLVQRDRHPSHGSRSGIGDALQHPLQADPHKAHAPLPVGIHLMAQAIQADRITLEAAHQHGNGDHQQQLIDPLQVAQTAALQLEEG
ncbi:hypothetical protein KBY66_13645 [Synechococcus sp. Tobar12-5m-g]|nr:hypothetical protein [Synechococcus sp. Tobar12-5m-g]